MTTVDGTRVPPHEALVGTTLVSGGGDDCNPKSGTNSAVDADDKFNVAAPSSQESASKSFAEKSVSIFLDDLFPKLYPALPEESGLKASRHERLSKGYESTTLTYGEVSERGFADILAKIRDDYSGLPEAGGTFYDLGSGTGVPVFVAAVCHTWDRCVGFEILSELHAISTKALERWHGGLKNTAMVDESEGCQAEIEFVCGDFTALDWSDGDVVFANSTCFDDELMGKVAHAAATLKEGAIFVSQTDPVPSPAFEILEETTMVQAGRTATTCYIQRRLPKPAPGYDPV